MSDHAPDGHSATAHKYDSASAFFAASPTKDDQLHLGQPWHSDGCEPGFQPGVVRYGWTTDELLIYADLRDLSIGNTATEDNMRTWETGDAFEIFLKPAHGTRYYEFHITPENLHLQLTFRSATEGRSEEATRLSPEQWMQRFALPPGSFQSTTEVDHTGHQWQALARIPFDLLTEAPPRPGDLWTMCCCRYDHTDGNPEPVLSTTGAAPQFGNPNFHDQRCWNPLVFAGHPFP